MRFANPAWVVVAIGVIAQRNSAMPGPKPRLHLPYADWPANDRLRWQQAFGQDDPFAEIRLAKASRDRCMWSWRRFLGFVTNNEPEALEIAPAERLAPRRVKAFVAHLATTNAPNSVAAVVEGLYTAARAMMPDRDWSWLRAIKLRLHAAVPAHSPGGPEITSVPLLELGLKLVEDNKPRPCAKLDVRQAVAYRDGLMLGFVAYMPLRPKNLASIEIGRHLVLVRDRWFVIIPREETKTKKPNQFEIPKILLPYLTFYLDTVRPGILRGRRHNALWVSPKGGPLSYVGITKSFARLSKRLGVRFSPHDARDAAVNTWAIARPDQICVARDLLYHSKLDTTGLYNRVRGIEASRAYRQVICEIRKKQTIR
jgi:integrase/recombinase XerD